MITYPLFVSHWFAFLLFDFYCFRFYFWFYDIKMHTFCIAFDLMQFFVFQVIGICTNRSNVHSVMLHFAGNRIWISTCAFIPVNVPFRVKFVESDSRKNQPSIYISEYILLVSWTFLKRFHFQLLHHSGFVFLSTSFEINARYALLRLHLLISRFWYIAWASSMQFLLK